MLSVENNYTGLSTSGDRSYPYWSRALGCNPSQIEEMAACLKWQGCETQFHPVSGFAEIRSRGHFLRLMKVMGVHERDEAI